MDTTTERILQERQTESKEIEEGVLLDIYDREQL